MKKQDKGTIKKECQTCKIEFISFLSDNRKFCSRKCFERKRKPTLCKGCGIEFYVPGEPNMKYHSKECYNKNGNKGTFKKEHKINQNRIHSIETKNKIRNSKLGKKISNETKIKMSQTAIKNSHIHNVQKYGKWAPNYNPKACQIIEEFGNQNGYNFQHALNGGEFHIKELGYWIDGYDKEKNVVIEYQEKYHLNPKRIEKDKRRKEEIIKALKCKFIYIHYNNKIEIWE